MNRVFIPKRLIVLYRFRFNTWFRSLIFFLVSTTARSRLRRSGEEEEVEGETEEEGEGEEEVGVAIGDLEEDKVKVEEGVVVEVGFSLEEEEEKERVDLSLEEVLEKEEEVLLEVFCANLRLAFNSAILACSNWMSLGSSWLRRVSS